MSGRTWWIGFCGTVMALVAVRPAAADLAVIGRYTFLNGDTATRESYFTSRRVRVSTPDGREVIFDSKGQQITLVDHRRRVFWQGRVARADSIVDFADGTRWELMLQHSDDRVRAEWAQDMEFPTDSIRVEDGFTTRTIAGYPCNRWVVRAGSIATLERWTAAALAVEPYDDVTSDVVLAAILDPVARAVLGMFWQPQDDAGLCLAASVTYDTPTQQGAFRWEAVRVIGERIPASAWAVPPGYTRVRLSTEIPSGTP